MKKRAETGCNIRECPVTRPDPSPRGTPISDGSPNGGSKSRSVWSAVPRGTAFGRRHLHQSAGRVSDLTKLSLFARQQAQLHFRSRPAARGWLGRDWIRKTAGFYRPAHQAGLVPSLASLGWPKLETARRRVGAREWRPRNTVAGAGSTAARFRRRSRRRAQNSQYLWQGFRRWARSTVSFHSAVPTVASSAGGCRQAAQALGR